MITRFIAFTPIIVFWCWCVWKYVSDKRRNAGHDLDRDGDDSSVDKPAASASITDPYRTAAKAPVEPAPTPPVKRYCVNCKHLGYLYQAIQEGPICLRLGFEDDPIKGPGSVARHATCSANADYACPWYVAKVRRLR